MTLFEFRVIESLGILIYSLVLPFFFITSGFFVMLPFRLRRAIYWWEYFCVGFGGVTLLIWYAFLFQHSVSNSVKLLAVVILFLIVIFWNSYKKMLLNNFETFLGLFAFSCVFVSLIFFQIYPDVLSIFITGNNDVFNYANHAMILIADDPFHANNWIGTDLIDAVKKDVFGATVWLAIPSIFSGKTPIENATAAIIGASSVCGLLIFELYRKALSCNWMVAAVAAAFSLLGSGFVFVFSYYFLAQIIFFIVFISILLATFSARLQKNIRLSFLVFYFVSYYFVLFFAYPYLFFSTGGMHVVLMAFLYLRRSNFCSLDLIKIAFLFPLGVIISICTLIPMKVYFNYSLIMQTAQSQRASDQTVSLLSIFGYPFAKTIFNGSLALNMVVLCCLALILTAYLVRNSQNSSSFLMSGISVVILMSLFQYGIILLYYGQSYQLVKFSTFYFVPLSGFVFFAFFDLTSVFAQKRLTPLFIFGLFAISILNYKNSLIRYSIKYPASVKNLVALNYLSAIQKIYIGPFDFGVVMLLGQFIFDKYKIPTSPSYYNFQSLDPQKISVASPVLIKAECDLPAEDQISIQGGFTLIQRLPRVKEQEIVEFDRDTCMRIIEFEGFSVNEAGGRWTQSRDVSFKLMFDNSLNDVKGLHLFIEMVPFLNYPTIDRQTVRISVNNGSFYDFVLTQREDTVVKVPLYGIAGDSLTKILLALPDSRSPASVDPSSRDARQLGIFVKRVWIGSAEP